MNGMGPRYDPNYRYVGNVPGEVLWEDAKTMFRAAFFRHYDGPQLIGDGVVVSGDRAIQERYALAVRMRDHTFEVKKQRVRVKTVAVTSRFRKPEPKPREIPSTLASDRHVSAAPDWMLDYAIGHDTDHLLALDSLNEHLMRGMEYGYHV